MAPHRVPLLSVSSLFFSEWVPPLQGWKSLPCELSHRSAMQPSLQLCCHRHDSGHPAPVAPHMSQMIVGFFDLRNFLCYVPPEGSSSSFSLPGLGNAGVPAMVLLSPKWHHCIGPMLCHLTVLRRLNFEEGRLPPSMHLSPSPSSQEFC